MDKNTLSTDQTIMVVDDVALYRSYARNILEDCGYKVILADSGEQALELLRDNRPHLILLDIVMPGINGYETFEAILKDPATAEIPVIFLSAESDAQNELQGFQMGAADFISKPFVPEIMIKRVERVLSYDNLQQDLARKVAEKSRELEQITLQVISTIASIVDSKDRYTKGHSARVAQICLTIAKNLGFSKEKQTELYTFALLHDIGKIGIPDLILNKPTKLTAEEYEVIKHHTDVGANILKDITILPHASDVARWHHERFDGTGYPDGLSGTDIPLPARIISLADAYDAMSTKRPYRNSLTKEEILAELAQCKGTQFDPTLTDLMIHLIETDALRADPSEDPLTPVGEFANDSNHLLSRIYTQNLEESSTSIAIDPLTQTYSIGYFVMAVNDRTKIPDENGYFIVCSVQNFDTFNETYGTVVGENLLIELADILRLNIRENDLVGRIDSSDFALYLSGNLPENTLKNKIKEFYTKFEETLSILDYNHVSGVVFGATKLSADDTDASFDQLLLESKNAMTSAARKKTLPFEIYQNILSKSKTKTSKQLNIELQNLEKYLVQRRSGEVEVDLLSVQEVVHQILKELRTDSDIRPSLSIVALNTEEDKLTPEELKECMEILRNAIKLSLRHGDFDLQYNDHSYLLIIPDVNRSQLESVMGRIEGFFHKLYAGKKTDILYVAHCIDEPDES